MDQSLHHIRLCAGLEIESGQGIRRTLSRDLASELAGHLATDLARVLPSADQAALVLGAGLFEPNELLRPGLPAWQALEDLAGGLMRQSGFRPQLIAFGSHEDRMPHAELQPASGAAQGHFLAIPLLLTCPADMAREAESTLEAGLFESGNIDPPARALLHKAAGLASVHGQLLTANDLIALQHVQLDSVGLGGFWPVIEHLLLAADSDHSFDLPATLRASWHAGDQRMQIRFVGHDQALSSDLDYALWTRAFRTLTALLDAHGVTWHPHPEGELTHDPRQQMMIETAGATERPDGLTVHRHPELGLVAWTLVEDGRVVHLYPLRPHAAGSIEQEFAARHPGRVWRCNRIHTDSVSGKLAPGNP
jgi:hypothetical protein